jgi:hypothetical protein
MGLVFLVAGHVCTVDSLSQGYSWVQHRGRLGPVKSVASLIEVEPPATPLQACLPPQVEGHSVSSLGIAVGNAPRVTDRTVLGWSHGRSQLQQLSMCTQQQADGRDVTLCLGRCALDKFR